MKVSVFAVYIEYNRPQPLCGLWAAHDSNQVFKVQTHLHLVWLEMSRTCSSEVETHMREICWNHTHLQISHCP